MSLVNKSRSEINNSTDSKSQDVALICKAVHDNSTVSYLLNI